MMSDDSEENRQFIIQDSNKSWGYTSAAKKLRAAGPVHEKKGRGKQGGAYAVQKDMEIQEAHRLLTEAGVGDQEMDENEREQVLVALRNSLKNTQAAQKNKDEDEMSMKNVEMDKVLIFSTTSDSEIPPETHVKKSEKVVGRLRRDQRGKSEATSKVKVENLPKRERKRKFKRNISESEEVVEVSSSSDCGGLKESSEATTSKPHRSPLQVTDEHRQRVIHMLSKRVSQPLTPIKEKRECEETSEALFMTGKENLSGKTVSWDKEEKNETATASDQAELIDMGDSVANTTERVAGAESDQTGFPHLHELKVPVTDEEQSSQEIPYVVASPYEPQHKTEESTHKGATSSSLYQEEEESSDDDKKPLPHDDIFCWCNTKPCKQLKRRYRRKQLLSEKNTYFCPSPLINPSNYSKVILKLFNLYFAQYTNYQKTFFQNMLSWGSSVTVGHHCCDTLTAKKRRDPSLGFDLESNAEHAFSPSPTSRSDPRKNVQAEHHALNQKRQLEKRDSTGKFSQKIHSLRSTHTLETEDSQPYDSDDELPDITFPSTQSLVERDNQGMESQQDSKDQMEVQTVENEKSSSSESSGIIWEDSGDWPHLSASSDPKLTVLRSQQQNSSHRKRRRDNKNLQISRQFSPVEALEQKEITRKRKQENNPMEEDVCSVSDEEFEILFLQKKKHSGAKKRHGEVCATGQKRPVRIKCTEDISGQQMKMALSEGSLHIGGFHSQDSSESRLGRRAEHDKVMEPASDKESKKGHYEGPAEQAENDVYVPKIASRDPSSTRQTQKGYRQNEEEVTKTEQVISNAEGPNAKQLEVKGDEDQSEVQCPMCFKSFPKDVVEEHAYICQGSESLGDISDDRPLQRVFPQRSETSDLLLRPLTRQPIHDSDSRVAITCTICETQGMGERAYQQHCRICLKRTLPSQQHLVEGGQLWREQSEFDVPVSRHVALRDNPGTSIDTSQDMPEDSDSDLHSDDTTNDPDFIPSIKQ